MFPLQTPAEILSWLRRRWLIIVAMMALGLGGGVWAALNSPRVYATSAVIQVTTPVIATEDDRAGITRRVQAIEQRLMSRDSLLELARRFDLFQNLSHQPDEIVGLMRRSIQIEGVAAAEGAMGSVGALSAIIVTAFLEDPTVAPLLANEIASRLVRESTDGRRSQAEQTLTFFGLEVARIEQEMAVLADEIADFQAINAEVMTGALTARRDELRRIEDERLALNREIIQARTELATLDQSSTRTVTQRRITQLNDQIAGRERELALLDSRIAELNELFQRGPDAQRELATMERRMAQLQTQLAGATARRTEAEVSRRVESEQQSERFDLIETATEPDYPISRSRRTVALAGVVGGFGLGLVVALALEWAHPVLRTAARMERELQLRPVISIPMIRSNRNARRQRLIWALGTIALVSAGLLLVARQLLG